METGAGHQWVARRVPAKKIAIEDVQFYLSSHYENTEYDYLTKEESPVKNAYRPISVTVSQECSIMQIRSDRPEGYKAIQWLCFGLCAAAPWVPFYTNIKDTPANCQIKTGQADPTNSAYRLYKCIQALLEGKQQDWQRKLRAFQADCQSLAIQHVDETDRAAEKLSQTELAGFLTEANDQIAAEITAKGKDLFDQLVKDNLNNSIYKYRP